MAQPYYARKTVLRISDRKGETVYGVQAYYNGTITTKQVATQIAQESALTPGSSSRSIGICKPLIQSKATFFDRNSRSFARLTGLADIRSTHRPERTLNPLRHSKATFFDKIESIDNRMGEHLDISTSISSILQETQDDTKRLGDVLRSEVDEIETKMSETNKLLTQKFDEFAELLRKSNTEALVKVMEQATKEFQQQMNEIVSKLVQENFEQLNQSVERLNTWQQENKQMIASLTQQYTTMVEEFGKTSDILSSVADYTQQLSGASGTLARLVTELQKVMIEDTKFTSITTTLADTANLTKENMVKFDDATSTLNEWIKKQRNFVNGVQLLIQKLEELSSIRDYNNEFWKDTKKHLEEGVGLIKKGSESLNAQLRDLDKEFYSRLSATLAELDACIQAMVTKR